jgi:hypothetical protein
VEESSKLLETRQISCSPAIHCWITIKHRGYALCVAAHYRESKTSSPFKSTVNHRLLIPRPSEFTLRQHNSRGKWPGKGQGGGDYCMGVGELEGQMNQGMNDVHDWEGRFYY